MKSKRNLILGIIIFAMLLAGAFLLYQQFDGISPRPPELQQSLGLAPGFSVEGIDGNSVALHDIPGKPVVINFWASWCPPCRSHKPAFDKLYQELGGEIEFMMINLTGSRGETKEGALNYIENQGYSFPVYFDFNGEAARAYGVSGIPHTFFINARGEITHSVSGAMSEHALRHSISTIQ